MTLNDHMVHGHDDGLDDNRAWTRVTCKGLDSSPFSHLSTPPCDPGFRKRPPFWHLISKLPLCLCQRMAVTEESGQRWWAGLGLMKKLGEVPHGQGW